jgi:lysophospholipase L1-like esterase
MSTLVALGDSVTVGVGDVGTPMGWAAHLAWALRIDTFRNEARLGARARDVTREQFPVARAARPDLSTLLVGGNDVLRGDFSPQDVGSHVERMVEGLQRDGGDVLVVLLHDPRRTMPGPRIVRDVLGERAESVNCEVQRRLSGASRLALVDPRVSHVTSTSAAWSVDRLHPSALGHRELAGMALAALEPLGWQPSRGFLAPSAAQPSPARRAWWLLRHGTPWFAKRSRDLLPELAVVCWRHHRTRASRRTSLSALPTLPT